MCATRWVNIKNGMCHKRSAYSTIPFVRSSTTARMTSGDELTVCLCQEEGEESQGDIQARLMLDAFQTLYWVVVTYQVFIVVKTH